VLSAKASEVGTAGVTGVLASALVKPWGESNHPIWQVYQLVIQFCIAELLES